MPPLPELIDHRYRVQRRLGEGLSGEVFLVELESGRFALKLLKAIENQALEADLVAAFKFEFAFLKDLRHPNVVRIQDFGFDAALRRFYFTEEFLAGQPINEFAAAKKPGEIAELFLQAIRGLQAIHRAHLLHGDIKGNNLMVVEGPEGAQVKLIDLGLADPRFTSSGGTPSTMAPEKILKEPADERSDLYSLGVVFYQLFAGANPFARSNRAETYEAHLTFVPPKLSLKNPKVPAYWNEIFDTLLKKNPAHRYRDTASLLAAIDFARPSPDAPRSSPPWRLERWIGRSHLLESLTAQIRRALQAKRPAAFLLIGEAGVGKSRIAQELKYLFQMEKVRVAAPPQSGCDLWIAEVESCLELPDQAPVLVLTLDPDRQAEVHARLEATGRKVSALTIPPLTRDELKSFLLELSGLKKIPENFLHRLWERTRGNPQLLVSLLESLAEQQHWVDAQGRWNLAVFREADLDFDNLAMDLSAIDSALAAIPGEDHLGRAELWIKRAEELLKRKNPREAAEALAAAETEAQRVTDLATKLRLRAAVYERQGLLKINGHRYEEARARFERALALLEESGIEDEPRYLRAQNYLAWLLCQEGKIDQSISLFEQAQGRWEALPPAERSKVLNQDLGFAYLQKGEAARAIAALEAILPFYREVGDPQVLMKAYYNLGEAHLLAKDYAAAVESFSRGSELMRLQRHFEFLLRAYNGLGKARHLQGDLDSALDDYRRGLELADYLRDYSSAAALAQNIGTIQAERGSFDSAQGNFELALNLLKKLPEKNAHALYLEARALVEIGDLFRRQGRYAEAETQARDADRMAAQQPSLAHFRFWTLFTRAEIARDEGDLVRLQDLLAELLPLADDAEKKEHCKKLQGKLPPSLQASEATMESDQTRVREFSSEDPEELRRMIRELQGRLERAEQELSQVRESTLESSVLLRFAEMNFVSRNKAMQDLFRTVERIRDTELAVVIHGESGTGKELLARSLHRGSRRHTGPFVAVNCAALPANLIESELFGYRAGAFTGAVRDKPGLIESAEGGTLFLDEIAELDLSLQAKLLRVLQEREIVRLGESRPRPVRFRLISASHRSLEEQVRGARFREDLFYRVAELELHLPPLRDRPEDVGPLAERFIAQYLEEHREKDKVKLSRELLGALLEYRWPGNVRELENLIRAATALRRGPQLRLQDLPLSWRERLKGRGEPLRAAQAAPVSAPPAAGPTSSSRSWRETEELILAKALLHFELDVRRAAAALGCAASKLYQRARESRLAEQRARWEAEEFPYRGESLEELKRRAFAEALAEAGGSAYRAARRLGVSPATVYQWTR